MDLKFTLLRFKTPGHLAANTVHQNVYFIKFYKVMRIRVLVRKDPNPIGELADLDPNQDLS